MDSPSRKRGKKAGRGQRREDQLDASVNIEPRPVPVSHVGNTARIKADRPFGFLYGLGNFIIMSSLIALIYIMMDHHCTICAGKCTPLQNVTGQLKDISGNVSRMNANYQDLESTITKIASDFPKIESQLEILESIANSLENSIERNENLFPEKIFGNTNLVNNDQVTIKQCPKENPFALKTNITDSERIG